MWDHPPPEVVGRRTKNYGLAGGWLIPPHDWLAQLLEEIRALPERKDRD